MSPLLAVIFHINIFTYLLITNNNIIVFSFSVDFHTVVSEPDGTVASTNVDRVITLNVTRDFPTFLRREVTVYVWTNNIILVFSFGITVPYRVDEGDIHNNFYINPRTNNKAPHRWVNSSVVEPKTGNLSLEVDLATRDSTLSIICSVLGRYACFNASIVWKRGRGSLIN